MKVAVILILTCISFSAFSQKKIVMLDSYFNNEFKKNANGEFISFHYKWDETSNSGFSILGDKFKQNGAELKTLKEAPNKDNLKGVSIYIIVDPDTQKESVNPKFISKSNADEIAKWVKAGGVLLLLANDSANTELNHFNDLAQKFNMHFNNDLISHVIDDKHFEDGAIQIGKSKIFKTSKKLFLKDACSISVKKPAKTILIQDAKTIMASSKCGKGYVFAVGDPWLYNEYVNGRLPASFENDKAANDLAVWFLKKGTK